MSQYFFSRIFLQKSWWLQLASQSWSHVYRFESDFSSAPIYFEEAEKVTCLTSQAESASFCCLVAAAHTHILNAPDSTIFMRAFFSSSEAVCARNWDKLHSASCATLSSATAVDDATSPKANVYNFVPSVKWMKMGVIFPDLFSQFWHNFVDWKFNAAQQF